VILRVVRNWLRDLRPSPMLADVARDFAKVGNDDHTDLQRIGHKPMLTAEQEREQAQQHTERDAKVRTFGRKRR
jgi:hypothetical protein